MQRFAATGLLTVFSGAVRKVGFDKNPLSFGFDKKVPHLISANDQKQIHEIERNQALISDLTDALPAMPRLYPSQKHRDGLGFAVAAEYVCIAPASVWFTKQYPASGWARLLDALPNRLTVYLLGGPGDRALCESLIALSKRPGIVNLAGKLSYLSSAYLQMGAKMNYVNDSAPMHFASAVGAPVAAVYCSTVPKFGFGPLGKRSFVIESLRPLPCRPCGLHGKKACPLGHFECATTISTHQLLAVLSA